MRRAIEVCLAVVALMLLGYAHAQPADLLGSEDSISLCDQRHWDIETVEFSAHSTLLLS